MKRFMSLLAIGLISTNVGCTLCPNCDDYTYGAFGGVWERTDLAYGRVGSAFSPQGYHVSEAESLHEEGQEPGEGEYGEAIAPPSDVAPPPAGDEAPRSGEEAPRSETDESSLLET